MVYVNILFKYKTGEVKEETRTFNNRYSALRFMYGIERKGHIVTGWRTNLVEEHTYLCTRFRLKPPLIRKD